jgi:hypothetical protein
MREVLVAAVVSPALLLVLGLVIGRLLRAADLREEARVDAAAVVEPVPDPAAERQNGTQPPDRITLGRS